LQKSKINSKRRWIRDPGISVDSVQRRSCLCLADQQVQNKHTERKDIESVRWPREIHGWAVAIGAVAYFPRQPIVAPSFFLGGTTPLKCLHGRVRIRLLTIFTTYHDS
jgi:hypothetical protein